MQQPPTPLLQQQLHSSGAPSHSVLALAFSPLPPPVQDVANTFSPSVGAKALTMRQALLVAAVFEFSGAVLMVSAGDGLHLTALMNPRHLPDQQSPTGFWPGNSSSLVALALHSSQHCQVRCGACGFSVVEQQAVLSSCRLSCCHCHCAGLQGAGVADTIRSGITNLNYFVDRPDILAYGELTDTPHTADGGWLLSLTGVLEKPLCPTAWHSAVAGAQGLC